MPDAGRFFNADPLSEKYAYQSHYNFSENRVTDGRELEGLEVDVLNDDGDFTSYSAAQSHANNTGGYVVLGQGEIPQVMHDIQGVVIQGPPATPSPATSSPANGGFGWGDAGRTAVGFVPFVGSGLDIYEGARDGNWMMLGIGVAGLALDVATMGSGSLIKGGVKAIGTELAEEGLELATKEITKDVAKTEGKVIGLGIADDLALHRVTGAITWTEAGWQKAGLTNVDWGKAFIDKYHFKSSFYDATKNAAGIRFEVSNFNPFFHKPGMTSFEFNHILNNPTLLQKTTFIQNGNQVFWNGTSFIK